MLAAKPESRIRKVIRVAYNHTAAFLPRFIYWRQKQTFILLGRPCLAPGTAHFLSVLRVFSQSVLR